MKKEETIGWRKLIADFPRKSKEGEFSLPAYSEFMPPPRLGCSRYGNPDNTIFSEEDDYGWKISEMEEMYELLPGIENIGRQVMEHIVNLGKGLPEFHIAGHKRQNLLNNPYWPPELAEKAGQLEHEQYVAFLPMMLSRTQDDKGRVRWTFFGNSVKNPEYAFWKSFYSDPAQELPEEDFLSLMLRILTEAYGEKVGSKTNLYSKGFRILKSECKNILPGWGKSYLVNDDDTFENVKYLLSFRPFASLPEIVRQKYLAGNLALLPFPGSLVFWGMPGYLKLHKELPSSLQIPLSRLITRLSGLNSIRVPQTGWIYEPVANVDPADIEKSLLVDTYNRTHRWQKIHKHEDELAGLPHLEKIVKTLFSTKLDTMGLYDKPMARNCHIWKQDFSLLLDGPNASPEEIKKAGLEIMQGGLFGYRFFFPPMKAGDYDVYWHRPVVAYVSNMTNNIEILPDALTGYISAYRRDSSDVLETIELWPRILKRETYLSALKDFTNVRDSYAHQTSLNIINLMEQKAIFGEKLIPRDFARNILRLAKHETLEQWLSCLSERACEAKKGQAMQKHLESLLEKEALTELPESLTYQYTATRSFEEAWWNDIFTLSHGKFINKDNADCVQDEVTREKSKHNKRDLMQLGDYLIKRHLKVIEDAGMKDIALCGELPFKWSTDFNFEAYGGWKNNQDGSEYERDILVIIPGKKRSEAVVMADHYDTAYMEDVFDKSIGGTGARLSAAGADDNHSATSMLLQAAPIFLQLAKEGKLERDVWLLHLTGEEFPSDCMGARYFCEAVINKTLQLKTKNDQLIDLSKTKIKGVFVSDMIGHNRDNDQDIFQASPGKSLHSLRLSYQAHLANQVWNKGTQLWNSNAERQNCKRGIRSADGVTIPAIAKHLPLTGEVRTHFNPRSSLYNTDGQIFSDVGIPVVLFMENYDIHRYGYHDTKDTMENIDLDYGAALVAIVIETVARVAAEK
ncbi:MAG: M28 family peptidase [Bacteroidales bacterium]